MSSEAKTADKIFIIQMLIYERNVQGKIRLLYQLGAEKTTFLYFYFSALYSLIYRLTDKIFIEYMLINERNVLIVHIKY